MEYDPSEVKLSEIKAAIEKAGYTPRDIEGEDIRDVESERRARALKIMRIRLAVAIVFAAPVLYIAMSHMFPALKLPIPEFMSPHDFPLIFSLVQLFLTVPVLLAGSRFFTVGFRTLFKGAPNMDTLVAIGTGSAFLYGVYATVMIYLGDFMFAQSLYFESAAIVITLVMLGKYLEAVSKGKTSEAIKKTHGLKAQDGDHRQRRQGDRGSAGRGAGGRHRIGPAGFGRAGGRYGYRGRVLRGRIHADAARACRWINSRAAK